MEARYQAAMVITHVILMKITEMEAIVWATLWRTLFNMIWCLVISKLTQQMEL